MNTRVRLMDPCGSAPSDEEAVRAASLLSPEARLRAARESVLLDLEDAVRADIRITADLIRDRDQIEGEALVIATLRSVEIRKEVSLEQVRAVLNDETEEKNTRVRLLIETCSSDPDSGVLSYACVVIDAEQLRRIEHRHNLFRGAKAVDLQTSEHRYLSNVCGFYRNVDEARVCGEGVAAMLTVNHVGIVLAGAKLPAAESTENDEMIVCDLGVRWSCRPDNCDEVVETVPVSWAFLGSLVFNDVDREDEVELLCDRCGEPFFTDGHGVSQHGAPGAIDYNTDRDHVPYSGE